VWVEVRNVCETQRAEASANWADFEFDASYVYVPNVFSPSASRAENASFHPFFPIGVELTDYRFEVFDRWGNMMFHSEQINEGWNGNFKSKDFKPGVCGWYLVAKIAYCGQVFEIKKKGDVTLVN
jgi:gliding motility-associated-like protein